MQLFRIFLISLFLVLPTYNSFADEQVKDPDLKLSLEELKKKYPIDWLEKRYGNYMDSACEGKDSEEIIREAATCLFFYDRESLSQFLERNKKSIFIKKSATTEQILDTLSAKFLDVFNDLSEAEIKSIIVHYNKYSYEVRVRDIINIMLRQIANTRFLHDKKSKIKNFFYSDINANQIDLFCDNLIKLDYTNKFYDQFALKYLKRSFANWGIQSLEGNIKNCISESKASEIKEKFLIQYQPQQN